MSRQDKLEPPEIGNGRAETPLDDDRLQVDLRLGLDEVAAAEEGKLRADARRRPTKTELMRLACKLYDSRRGRDRIFSRELFGEPAWDMLLALYCLPSRGEILGATALGYAADVPPTTALRWQKTLLDEGLIERGPLDGRTQLMALSQRGRVLLERYLIRLFYCEAAVLPDG